MARYKALLRTHGVARTLGASLIARLPLGAMGLVLILRTRDLGHGYGAGGVAVGAFAIGSGVTAPLLGRAIDRVGQTRVLVPSAIVSGAAIAAIGLLSRGAPTIAVVALAALGGVGLPPVGSCMRVLWNELVGQDRLHAALSLEAAGVEVMWLLGPLVLVGAVAAQSTRLAVVCCGALIVLGGLWFATTRASREWRPTPHAEGKRPSALRSGGVRMIAATLVLAGISFGAVEVAAAALTQHAGSPHAAGPLLALWGAASMVGGIVNGLLPAPANPVRRIAALLATMLIGYAIATAANGIALCALALVVCGAGIAPFFAQAIGLVTQLAPAGAGTEASTWISTGTTGGIAVGSSLAGALVSAGGSHAGFGVAAVSAAAGVVLVSWRAGRYRPEPERGLEPLTYALQERCSTN